MSIPHRDSPAPWKVYRTKDGSVLGVGDKHSGGVTDYQGGFWGSGPNRRANVFLVAAAPELYIVLAAIVSGADQNTVNSIGPQLWEQAVDALAHARGEP